MEPKLVLYPAFDLVFDKYKKRICADVFAIAKPKLTAEINHFKQRQLKKLLGFIRLQHKTLPQILAVNTKLTGSNYVLHDDKAVIFGEGCSGKPNYPN